MAKAAAKVISFTKQVNKIQYLFKNKRALEFAKKIIESFPPKVKNEIQKVDAIKGIIYIYYKQRGFSQTLYEIFIPKDVISIMDGDDGKIYVTPDTNGVVMIIIPKPNYSNQMNKYRLNLI